LNLQLGQEDLVEEGKNLSAKIQKFQEF